MFKREKFISTISTCFCAFWILSHNFHLSNCLGPRPHNPSWLLSSSYPPYPNHQKITCSKYIQNVVTSHPLQCYHPNSSHSHFHLYYCSSLPLGSLSLLWAPYFPFYRAPRMVMESHCWKYFKGHVGCDTLLNAALLPLTDSGLSTHWPPTVKHGPAWIFILAVLSGKIFLQLPNWLTSSLYSGLCSNVTSN